VITVVGIWLAAIILLAFYWARDIGFPRAAVAALLRASWTLPVLLSLFPVSVTSRVPGTVAMQPIHILLDDSSSMNGDDFLGGSSSRQAADLLKRIDDVCQQFGCLPKVTKLSELAPDTKRGFSPLSRVLEPWLFKTGGDPWMLMSDGGDFRPSSSWDDALKGRGADIRGGQAKQTSSADKPKNLGAIVAFGRAKPPGFSIESVAMAPLAFEGKSVQLNVVINRLSPESLGAERVQIQLSLDGKVLTSSEAEFGPGAPAAEVELTFSAPKRGPHIVTVKALPVAGELDTWDNTQTRVLDVMPNTVGVLHLLGSPAWDGRFMRRFLKAEPKFDVISFFILRDPWDSQQVSERELSLIPFPVERLFKEELVNFRVIVMQNFTLMRFLQPEYQENLAKFVKDGGGLLFIGGPRALTETDTSSSALSGLLPFTVDRAGHPPKKLNSPADEFNDGFGSMGATWDSDAKFSIQMANPDASRRALANVYEGWQGISQRLSVVKGMRGIHEMDIIKFRDAEITPLLDAKLADGRSAPLAVASYPGKGRALWLFTDSLWRLAMSPDARIARSDYHTFMDAALNWLTRGDMKGAITVRDFRLSTIGDGSDRIKWRAIFYGSAAKYLRSASSLRITVCGVGVGAKEASFGGAAGDAITAEGEIGATMREGSLCSLKLEAEHPSFGSIAVTGWSVLPETLSDENIGSSPTKLRALSSLTGAKFVDAAADRARSVEEWIQAWGASDGVPLPDKTRTNLEFYWPLELSFFWLALILIPSEVLVRRWHLIFVHQSESGKSGAA